jgi:hypothetical protein
MLANLDSFNYASCPCLGTLVNGEAKRLASIGLHDLTREDLNGYRTQLYKLPANFIGKDFTNSKFYSQIMIFKIMRD